MKSLKPILLSFIFLSFATSITQGAALVSVIIDSGGRTLLDQSSVPLSGGSALVNYDGDVVQLGYYQSATPGNNFGNGTFVPLTGEGSLFGVNTTIGDSVANGGDNGEIFSDRLDIFTGTNGGVNDGLFPSAGTPLSLRIFNNTTIASSTFMESLSNNIWLWQTPANSPSQPNIAINLDDTGLIAKSGNNIATPGSNIKTTTAVAPEPTSAALLIFGLVSLAGQRRRRQAK